MSQDYNLQSEPVEALDFLTPEQRCQAVAEIMATITLRILKAEHEQDQSI
jgi:hypothetical protein